MAGNQIGRNIAFEIYNADGTEFEGLVMHKSTFETVVMSLADKITGDVYYKDNGLSVTMQEYIVYNGVKYILVNPPTIIREGMVSDNSELKGITRYSFEFYHPMYQLFNIPFCDVAVSADEKRYLSESKIFSWIGKPNDFIAKLNKNLEGTQWICVRSSNFPIDKDDVLSPVIPFDNAMISNALKSWYDTWEIPYVVDQVYEGEAGYSQGKRFKVVLGLPSNEVYDPSTQIPYLFRMGQGVGLKNDSRTPRNNKIVTRISGYGSEDNIPYGYPQIVWEGDPTWNYTINDDQLNPKSYPIYDGIVNGENVRLIKHPFTRTHLMPSIYVERLNKKVNPYASEYDPDIELIDYYDADGEEYPNKINPLAPSYEIHAFEDVKPELGDASILDAVPVTNGLEVDTDWDDTMDENGNYIQSYFRVTLPVLSFDLYACAAITQEMQINMRSGACLGCTFPIMVDWEDYKLNFYDSDGNFAPDGEQRDYDKYPDSSQSSISVILQKEYSTFGVLMPNRYQYPKSGDKFVILGISLPLSYIHNAEARLDDEMKSYMLLNNVYYFDYPLKFDEYFLAKNTGILSQIRTNTIIRFLFAGVELHLYVKQISIKFGDGTLPKYDITLTDNIDVVVNPIGQVRENVDKLAVLLSMARQSTKQDIEKGSADKLSRIYDDEAHGLIGFLKGAWFGTRNFFINALGNANFNDTMVNGQLTTNDMRSTNYTGDGMFDTGGLFQYLNGKAKLVCDNIVCRGKFVVNEIEDRIWTYAGGNLIFSAAGSTIFYVEYLDEHDEPLGYTYINSPWLLKKIPLLARVIAWSKKRQVQKQLTPEEKERVVKFRCYETSDDGTMQTRNWWHVNDLALCQTLNRVKDKVTEEGGYSGSLSNTVYCRRVAAIGSKKIPLINDNKIYDYVELWNVLNVTGKTYIDDDGTEKTIVDAVSGYDNSYVPDWPAAGDVLVQRGNAVNTERQGFSTVEVTGTQRGFKVYDDVNNYSMEGKKKAFLGYDADKKRGMLEVFGDAYIGAYGTGADPHDGSTYVKFDSKRSVLTVKAKIDVASTVDDKSLENYINGLITDITDVIQTQVDQKAETWFQANDPSTAWTTAEERNEHIGDLWHRTTDNKNFYYQASGWVEEYVPNEVFDTIDGKAAIYVTWNAWMSGTTNNLQVKDLFIPESDTTQGGKTYKKNKAYRCTNATTPTFEEFDYTDDGTFLNWKAGQYVTDLTGINTSIGNVDTKAGNAQTTANNAATAAANAKAAADALDYVKTALKEHTVIEGGLVLATLIGVRSNGTTYGGINGAYSQTLGGKTIAAWFGGNMIDRQSDGTYSNTGAVSLVRMDGSGYLAGGKINWDESGNANFDGKITASEGKIANFEINQYYLGNTTSFTQNGIYLDSRGVVVSYNDGERNQGYAGEFYGNFSVSYVETTTSGAHLTFTFIDLNDGKLSLGNNIGGTIEVNSNTPLVVKSAIQNKDSNPESKIQLATDGIDVYGQTEFHNDVCFGGSLKTSSFTLPASPRDGQTFFCKGLGNDLTVTTRSHPITWSDNRNNQTPANSSVNFGDDSIILVFSSTYSKWIRFDCW